MLLRRLRPQHLTYDPFTLDYLRDSSRLNESIHSVICCDTLQLLGGSCQISLCWILPVNKQLPSSPMKTLLSASLLTRRIDGSQFIAGEETDLMLWVHEKESGVIYWGSCKPQWSLWGIRDWGWWRAHSLWMMHCFFSCRALTCFSYDVL